jgi:type IV pilus assembly protein PilA
MIARIHKAMAKKDQGFTLIELLVVVIIIGILAAIAIPVFLNQRKSAVDAGVKSDVRTVANELETYFVNNQKYPAATEVSKGTDNKVSIGTGTTAKKVTLSNDTTVITYKVGSVAGTYTVEGYNTESGTDTVFTYDSANGGLDDGKPRVAAGGAGG